MNKKTATFFLLVNLFLAGVGNAIANPVRSLLVSHEEMEIVPAEIIHLPGIGLGLYHSGDSIMLLDDPALGFVELLEPIPARSFVVTDHAMYAASGDSIYRVASDSLPREFIGRFDNEQFTLSRADGDSFFVTTADEDFSCVYQVFPDSAQCEPIIGVDGPIYRIENNGIVTMVWAGDTVYILTDDYAMRPVYQGEDINDAVMSPLGLFVATTKELTWIPGPDREGALISEPVLALWWDNADALYYLDGKGDLYRITGLVEQYLSTQ